MFKMMTTVARGLASQTTEAEAARQASAALALEIREAAQSLDGARNALATAETGFGSREAHLRNLVRQIDELELRVFEAIAAGLEEAVTDGIFEVSQLEAERNLASQQVEDLRGDVAKLRSHLRESEKLLRRLCLGRDAGAVRSRVQALCSAGDAVIKSHTKPCALILA